MPTNSARIALLANAAIPRKVKTYAAQNNMVIASAIKQSIATSTSTQSYSGAALDGSIGQGAIDLPQSVSLTTSAAVGAYATGAGNKIVVTGVDIANNAITGYLTLTAANGGETVVAVDASGLILGFAKVTNIAVPPQLLTSGAFQWGVRDVVLDTLSIDIRGGAASSNIVVGNDDGTTDTVPTELGEHLYYAIRVVFGSSTAFPITIAA